MTAYTLEILTGTFAILRLDANERAPEWAIGEFVSITRTRDELSIVCPEENVPHDFQRESSWRCLRIVGRLDFSIVGVIASLTRVLATANISVFVVSTFDTDYLLVKDCDLEEAAESIRSAGHLVLS